MGGTIYFYTRNDPWFEFSNFSPFGIQAGNTYWPTVEHYFQAAKFDDPAYRERIRTSRSPKDARILGQSRALPIRADWDSKRLEVMLEALRLKFRQRELRALLLSTGESELIESSPVDFFWGSGQDGSGQKMLGRLLMQVREELRAE